MDMIKLPKQILLMLAVPVLLLGGCAGAVSTDEIVRVEEISGTAMVAGLGESDLEAIDRLRESSNQDVLRSELETISSKTQKLTIEEYLGRFDDPVNSTENDYRVGGGDVLNIIVYDEPDLTRSGMRVARDGTLSFPLLGRVKVDGLTTSQIEERIANRLAEAQFLLDAQVTVLIDQYGSKKYQMLGEIRRPGSYPLKADERLLDAISEAGGVDPETAGKELVIVRTINRQKATIKKDLQPGGTEKWGRSPSFTGGGYDAQPVKIVIIVELERLLRGNDLISNLALHNNDVIYLPKAEFFYIMGQVKKPGSYKFTQKNLTLVGAIGSAGGFTNIAARKKTRIIRLENGVEKIITVNVDAITAAGRKIQDIRIKPDDIIIVPQSFF
ncbi:MAG: polysaccharide biosynthesis/export family protein [Desulfobulbales bacterium]|nr:polysaccharide biosynthesis/export family protein [Desulfobulbales bacterium]